MRKVKYPDMGSRIKKARLNANLKQKDCLEPLGDITPQMLSDWENGYVCPSLDYLKNISTFFNLSLDYIVFGKECGSSNDCLESYSDVTSTILKLLNTGMFEFRITFENSSYEAVRLFSLDEKIVSFMTDYKNLLTAAKSMKKELFDQAVEDLIKKYNYPLK